MKATYKAIELSQPGKFSEVRKPPAAPIDALSRLRRYGIEPFPLRTVDVLVAAAHCGRASRGYVRIRRTIRLPDLAAVVGEIKMATVPRAVIDAALDAPDVRVVRAIVAGAVQKRMCTAEQLEAELGPFRLRKRSRDAIPAPTDNGAAARSAGVLRYDSDGWRLPEGLAEAGETESNGLRPGRVVLVITILAIIFISIMAWFVSQMPEK